MHFIVSVGGFLGVGEKDVAVPFNAIRATQKDGKWYLTMSAAKDALKSVAGYKYDRPRPHGFRPDARITPHAAKQ
jgi:hypothetical protein